MIVWSKGLGKKSLPMEIDKAFLKVSSDHLAMEGSIESVCWDYSMKLYTADLADFMKHLAHPKTAQILAREKGILMPLVFRLVMFLPRLSLNLLRARILDRRPKGASNEFLV